METDPYGKDPHASGAKVDLGKAPVFQGLFNYFPLALIAVANVSDFGSKKYTWNGWESVPDGQQRYLNALGRHLLYGTQEENDPDSGLSHKAHAAWNALATLELYLRERASTEPF